MFYGEETCTFFGCGNLKDSSYPAAVLRILPREAADVIVLRYCGGKPMTGIADRIGRGTAAR